MNSAEFAALDESKVRDEEVFMHRLVVVEVTVSCECGGSRYFTQKLAADGKLKKKSVKLKVVESPAASDDEDLNIKESDLEMDFAE